MVQSYRDLTVWKKSFELSKQVYLLTQQLPKSEQFGLSSQLQRCAVSIPGNIAEGNQRNNTKEFIQFLGIARGSVAELETQLLLIRDIYGLKVDQELEVLLEIQRMINALIKSLRAKT